MESGRLQPALQSTFFWGCIAMVAAIVLAVVAAMIHDIRWVLIFAWPFAIFAAWEFARICSTKKSVMLSAAGIATVITGVLLGWLYFALAPTKIAIDSVPDTPASKVAQAFELARIPQLGQPLQPIEETDAVYQAAHEHAMVVSLLPMLDVFIFQRDLDLGGLRARWQSIFQRQAPTHLTRHLLFAVIAYRLQADRFGDLDHATKQVLDRTIAKEAGPAMSSRLASFDQKRTELTPGTVLVREWDRQSQRVMVMADGFAWNGQTYDSLSKVAFAITGTKWNGPRFFGLRDKEDRSSMEARP